METKDMKQLITLLGKLQKAIGTQEFQQLLYRGCFVKESTNKATAIKYKNKYRALGFSVDAHISSNSSGCTPDEYQCYIRLPESELKTTLYDGEEDEF